MAEFILAVLTSPQREALRSYARAVTGLPGFKDDTANTLRPDLESGLLSQHDYNSTISFASKHLGIFPHMRFVETLEDPDTLSVALENARERSGFQGQLNSRVNKAELLQAIRTRKDEKGDMLIVEDSSLGDGYASNGSTRDPASTANTTPARGTNSPPQRSKGAWDAIREANSPHPAKQSVWEEVRQRHERQRVPGPQGTATLQATPTDDQTRA
ncbi:uncharacterized protein BXZ73DRAFT_96555 [Epithele typhae]|uniref:uncharacterized protein n=1 Tax=Epithele typhae TaxID=378194 RepID=UPI0020084A9B|nr:uncharacterized protein BXZ73DRAFT_96555 [Epithele typhae]KAH9944045.1 hypothetical protein BXZ73DRAFT_96555 [Epithele typhae]